MNAFAQWMQANGLRNVDVARAFGVSPTTTFRWTRDFYWPRTREDAIRLFNFSGGRVTPDRLLPLPSRDEIGLSEERRLAQAAIREAKERNNGKKAKGG